MHCRFAPTYPPYVDEPFSVIFYRGYNLWLSETGGSREWQLTNEGAEWPIRDFAVSPEGDKVAYTIYKGPPSGDALIKQVYIPTGSVSVLAGENDQCSEYDVKWLDATHIAFRISEFPVQEHEDQSCWPESDPNRYGLEVFDHILIDLATGERTFVPESLGFSQSPNGRYWLTGSCYYVYECPLEYVLHDLETGEEWRVAESIGWGHFIGWSPDSRLMLFSAYERGETSTPVRLVAVDTATQQERLIISDDRDVRTASWSPSGQEIAFTECKAEDCSLWLVGKDGNSLRQIPTEVPHIGWSLDWSPDGSRLVFTEEGDTSSVWSVRLDGTDLRPIIARANQPYVVH